MLHELRNNYMYFYHTDNFVILPSEPEEITDTLSANFNTTSILSRSAPIFTYSNSGPRSIQIRLSLHREMMSQINYGKSNFNIEIGDDYVDTLIKQIQAIALPRYDSSQKLVDPPLVALRFGNEIFIKGCISGAISITYTKPLLSDGKYAMVDIGFTINEIDPIDALHIQQYGSFRPIPRTLERRIYKG